MTTLTKEEITQTLEHLRHMETEYRKRGFDRIADGYLSDIARYEAKLSEPFEGHEGAARTERPDSVNDLPSKDLTARTNERNRFNA